MTGGAGIYDGFLSAINSDLDEGDVDLDGCKEIHSLSNKKNKIQNYGLLTDLAVV